MGAQKQYSMLIINARRFKCMSKGPRWDIWNSVQPTQGKINLQYWEYNQGSSDWFWGAVLSCEEKLSRMVRYTWVFRRIKSDLWQSLARWILNRCSLGMSSIRDHNLKVNGSIFQNREEKTFLHPEGSESLEFSTQQDCEGFVAEYIQAKHR